MPYIGINLTGTLPDNRKEMLKSEIGEKIALIPGKTERVLMIDLSENHTMYMGGERRPLAFVDVRCYGEAEFAHKKAFTEAAFAAVQRAANLGEGDIYLTYSEFATWGTRGSLK